MQIYGGPRHGRIPKFCDEYSLLQTSNLFLEAGAGYVRMWNNRSGEPSGLAGGAFAFGLGYDFLVTEK